MDYRLIAKNLDGKCIVLAVTGGIAAYKSCEIVRLLRSKGADVRVIMTDHAREFIQPLTFQALTDQSVMTSLWTALDQARFPHIHLADLAAMVIVAPATANIIAKMAAGIADDYVSTFLLSVDVPVMVAPAMNPRMYQNPATRKNIETLKTRGIYFIGPESGEVACGHVGPGRMSEPSVIVDTVSAILGAAGDLAGRKVLITAGPTREPIDPVRYISNRSTGLMGFSLAAAAVERGAEVTLISGPSALAAHVSIRRIDVESTSSMLEEVKARFPENDVLIMSAAVCDYKVRRAGDLKMKKDSGTISDLDWIQTPDILDTISKTKHPGQRIVGFAAETNQAVEFGREKMQRKNLDMMIVNDVSRPDAGFEVQTNTGWVLFPDGRITELPLLHKRLLADTILDHLKSIL